MSKDIDRLGTWRSMSEGLIQHKVMWRTRGHRSTSTHCAPCMELLVTHTVYNSHMPRSDFSLCAQQRLPPQFNSKTRQTSRCIELSFYALGSALTSNAKKDLMRLDQRLSSRTSECAGMAQRQRVVRVGGFFIHSRTLYIQTH